MSEFRVLRIVLNISLWTTLLLMGVATILNTRVPAVAHELSTVGTIALMSTPFVSVLILLGYFLRRKDATYAVAALMVLGILLSSFFFGPH